MEQEQQEQPTEAKVAEPQVQPEEKRKKKGRVKQEVERLENDNKQTVLSRKPESGTFLAKGNLYLLIGPSYSGKSYLLRYLLKEFLRTGQLKVGIVFSRTAFNGSFNFLPQRYVYSQFDPRILKHWLNHIVQFITKKRQEAKRKKLPEPELLQSFVVFDDMLGGMQENTDFMKSFISTYRQYGITLFITTQYATKVSNLIRGQTSIACIFPLSGLPQAKAVFENFGDCFDSVKQFREWLQKQCDQEKYRCVVWWANSPATLDQKYSFFKAPNENMNLKFDY